MKNSKNIAATTLAVFLATASSVAFADAQEEVNKQVAKLIGDAISNRVSARALDGAALGQRPAAAEKNALWGSYTRLRVDFTGIESRTNVYIAGYDRDLTENIILGASVDYSDTGTSGTLLGAFNSDSHGKGISPYLTYLFNKNIFGIVRVNYSEFSGGGVRTESYGAAASLNGVHRMGDLVARGRLELGTSRSDSGALGGGKQSTTNYSGDGELGYYFTPAVYGHVGLQLSESDSPNSYNASARIGIESNINRTTAVSLKYERKVDDNAPAGANFKVDSFTLALRLRF